MTDRQKCTFPNCGLSRGHFYHRCTCGPREKPIEHEPNYACHAFVPTPDTPTDRTGELKRREAECGWCEQRFDLTDSAQAAFHEKGACTPERAIAIEGRSHE